MWLGAVVGAVLVGGGLFGFEFAGPYRSPWPPPAPRVHADDPCVPVWCSDAPRAGWCVEPETERGGGYLRAPDRPAPSP